MELNLAWLDDAKAVEKKFIHENSVYNDLVTKYKLEEEKELKLKETKILLSKILKMKEAQLIKVQEEEEELLEMLFNEELKKAEEIQEKLTTMLEDKKATVKLLKEEIVVAKKDIKSANQSWLEIKDLKENIKIRLRAQNLVKSAMYRYASVVKESYLCKQPYYNIKLSKNAARNGLLVVEIFKNEITELNMIVNQFYDYDDDARKKCDYALKINDDCERKLKLMAQQLENSE